MTGTPQFQRRIDEPQEGTGAAGAAADLATLLFRMVQQQDRAVAPGQAAEWLQRFQHRGRVRFISTGEKCRQRIDDEQIQVLSHGEPDELLPLLEAGSAGERPRQPSDVVADRPRADAFAPLGVRLFRDEQYFRPSGRAVEERNSPGQTAQQSGQQRRLSGLPLAGEQGDVTGGQIAVPNPVQIGFDGGVVRGVDGARLQTDVGHGSCDL